MNTNWEKTFSKTSLGSSSTVLDLPCGNGRLSIALARQGHRVTGVDLSEEYSAQATASAGSLPVTFHPGDMREIAFTDDFDRAFSFGNSFFY